MSAGCGGNNGTATNNGGTNNGGTNNGGTNNGGTNNGGSNNGGSNNGGSNNGGTNNGGTNNVPAGAATFLQPAEATSYTNADLLVEVAVDGDAEAVELILDETEVLAGLDGGGEFVWDTTTVDEASYTLKLRFTVADEELWSDEKIVVVDRTAPSVTAATPIPDAVDVSSDETITVTFDEPIDPASVDTTTVQLSFTNGQATPHTVELSADGLVATIDYDRSAVQTPYEVVVTLAGVTDLAGNSLSDNWDYSVPAWLSASYPDGYTNLHYVSVDGSEYLVGLEHAGTSDFLIVLKNTATGWDKIISQTVTQTTDVAVDYTADTLFIAATHYSNASNVSGANLYTLDLATDMLTSVGGVALGTASTKGAVAIDIRSFAGQTTTVGAIAAVANGELTVYQFLDDQFNATSTNSLPAGSYSNVREDSLSVFVKADTLPEVVFGRCENALEPCVRTTVEQISMTNSGWEENPGVVRTVLHPPSSTLCDEFTNFTTAYLEETATLFFGHISTCSAPAPFVEGFRASATGWDDLVGGTNLMDSIPDPDDLRYSAHVAFGAGDVIHTLVASNERLMIAQVSPEVVVWMPSVASDLTTSAITPNLKILNPELFVTPQQRPLVVFRQGQVTHIYRGN